MMKEMRDIQQICYMKRKFLAAAPSAKKHSSGSFFSVFSVMRKSVFRKRELINLSKQLWTGFIAHDNPLFSMESHSQYFRLCFHSTILKLSILSSSVIHLRAMQSKLTGFLIVLSVQLITKLWNFYSTRMEQKQFKAPLTPRCGRMEADCLL